MREVVLLKVTQGENMRENMPLVENAMQLLAKRSAEDEMESPTISFVAKKLLKKYAPLEERGGKLREDMPLVK